MNTRLRKQLTIFNSMYNDLKEQKGSEEREELLERLVILYGDITVLVSKAFGDDDKEIYYLAQDVQLDVLYTIKHF